MNSSRVGFFYIQSNTKIMLMEIIVQLSIYMCVFAYTFNELFKFQRIYSNDTIKSINQKPIIASLILSGGGSLGAFQVGCLAALSEFNVVKFDTIDTVSVGGLIGSYIAQYDISQQSEAILNLVEIWKGMTSSRDIYKHWRLSFIEGIFYRSGLYNPKPLGNMIKHHIDIDKLNNSNVHFNASVANIHTGKFTTFGKEHPNIHNAILAGCSIPVFFPPVKIQGESYVDACVKRYVWSNDIIDKTNKPIIIITTRNVDEEEIINRKKNTGRMNIIQYGASVIQFFMDSLYENDMSCYINRPNVIVIQPMRILVGDTLKFDSNDIMTNMEIGYTQTRNMIFNGDIAFT